MFVVITPGLMGVPRERDDHTMNDAVFTTLTGVMKGSRDRRLTPPPS